MTFLDKDAQPDEFGNDSSQTVPDSGGQSGDTQDLSSIAETTDESVDELADTGQDYEAGVVEGVEDAGDHPERRVHTHENQRRPSHLAVNERRE